MAVTVNLLSGSVSSTPVMLKVMWVMYWLLLVKIVKLRKSTGIRSAAGIVKLTLLNVIVVPCVVEVLFGVPGDTWIPAPGGIKTENINISNNKVINKPIVFFLSSFFTTMYASTFAPDNVVEYVCIVVTIYD